MTHTGEKHTRRSSRALAAQAASFALGRRLLCVSWIITVLALAGQLYAASETATEQAPSVKPTTASDSSVPVFTSGVDAVSIDLVVRDRKGEIVHDLRAEEIEIFEDGIKQTVTAFNPIEKGVTVTLPPPTAARDASPGSSGDEVRIRRPRIVTMVFDQLSAEGRQLAYDAANEFVNTHIDPETFVGIFRIDRRLELVQIFTQNAEAVKLGVEQATLATAPAFSSGLKAMSVELKRSRSSGDPLEQGYEPEDFRPEHYTGDPDAGKLMDGEGAIAARRSIAEAALNALRLSEDIERTVRGRSSLYGLLALVNVQVTLNGRKTLVYFSEGLQVPSELDNALQTLVSAANRSKVSIYSVDVRGLTSMRPMEASREALNQVAEISRSQRMAGIGGGGMRTATRAQLSQFDLMESALRMDSQGTLDDLAMSTGGFLLANSNDMKRSLTRLGEEIQSYYEIAYTPRFTHYDGKFRRIKVKVNRPGVSVQSREGYYAIPHKAGSVVLGYELPLLSALANQKLPHDIDHRAKVFRFGASSGRVQYALVVEAPLARLSFAKDARSKRFSGRVSILALVRDKAGNVIEKLSQDYPLGGALDQLQEAKHDHVTLVRHFTLPPGEYSVEIGVRDGMSDRIGGSRSTLSVTAPPPGVAVSSIAVVASMAPLEAAEQQKNDPLLYESIQVTPDVGAAVQRMPGREQLALYNVVYPQTDLAETPRLTVELVREGSVVAQGTPVLPHSDSAGCIKHVVTLPLAPLQPGEYNVRFTVTQGASTALEQTQVTIEAP